MKKNLILCAALFCGGTILSAQNETISLNNIADWGEPNSMIIQAGEVLEFSKPGQYKSPKMIPFDPTKKYKFSGEVRKAQDSPVALFLAGFLLYDKDKCVINIREVNTVAGTDTELTVPVKEGDTVIRIKNGARWTGTPHLLVAFDTDHSFKDLPNRNLSGDGVVSVQQEGDEWIVTLAKPLPKAYPVGTKVREHAAGGYFYTAAVTPDEEWKIFGRETSGMASRLINERAENKFWPGTVFIVPLLMPNWNWSSPEINQLKTQLRNLKLEIIATAE